MGQLNGREEKQERRQKKVRDQQHKSRNELAAPHPHPHPSFLLSIHPSCLPAELPALSQHSSLTVPVLLLDDLVASIIAPPLASRVGFASALFDCRLVTSSARPSLFSDLLRSLGRLLTHVSQTPCYAGQQPSL